MLLHGGSFMAVEAELFLRNCKQHFNRVTGGLRRVALSTRQFPLRVHRLPLTHVGVT